MKGSVVKFSSHIDGRKLYFTPEKNVMDTQRTTEPISFMAFDECTSYPCDYPYAKKIDAHLTHRLTLKRCCDRIWYYWTNTVMSKPLMPIVQGRHIQRPKKRIAEMIASFERDRPIAMVWSICGEPAEEMMKCQYRYVKYYQKINQGPNAAWNPSRIF